MGRWHSFSSISTFERCPKKYEFQYRKRIKVERPVPVHWRFGTCVHAAMEAAYKEAQTEKVVGPMEPLTAVALDALKVSWAEESMPMSGGEYDRAIGIVQRTLEDLEVNWEDVLGVEQKLQTRSPDGSEFIGYMDLVLRLGPTSVLIRDYKVRSTQSAAEELVMDPQLNLYGFFTRQLWPWVETVHASHYYPPIQKEVMVTLTNQGMLDAITRWEAGVESTETETEWTPVPGDECDGCVYKDQCPAWAGKVPDDQRQF